MSERPIGFGPLRRKEDARFIRGRGRYVDDVALTGMLHGAVLRSPLAHARIVSIDTSAALHHPKVHAVLTGADLEAQGMAWMPTLSADTQAVLATDKVRFQGQEVAFVIADDRYSARDALELIDVEYEPLAVVVDARAALEPDAPVIRDDHAGRADNHIFDWESGDAAATEAAFARCRRRRRAGDGLPALAPGADGDVRRDRRLRPRRREAHRLVHDAGAARAPDALRARHRPAGAQDPRHLAGRRRRLRQQGPGLPRLRLRDGRDDAARPAGEVDGGPLGEPDVDRASRATTRCTAGSPPRARGRSSPSPST